MKKTSLLILLTSFIFNSIGQNYEIDTYNGQTVTTGWKADDSYILPCQSVEASFVSSSPLADTNGFIDICLGDTVTFTGGGIYSQNNLNYAQSDSTSLFTWDFGNGQLGSAHTVSVPFNSIGTYNINLTIADINGCLSTNNIGIKVRVATIPTFSGTTISDSLICYGDSIVLSGQVNPVSWGVSAELSLVGTTFLPDGSGASYTTSIIVDIFAAGQTLTSVNDFLSVCAVMEHSYLGDLDISIECPNGTVVFLKTYPGCGGTYLGVPIDIDPNLSPGVGWEYCWAPPAYATYQNMNSVCGSYSTMPSGSYQPVGTFNDFIGCPLNGAWTIEITDHLLSDNGYIFEWGLNFNPSLIPTNSSYTPEYPAANQMWNMNPPVLPGANGATIVVYPDTGIQNIQFTVMDNFGCSFDTSIQVDVLPTFLVDFGPDITLCANEVLVLDATNGGTNTGTQYIWHNQVGQLSTGDSYTVDTTGTYWVEIPNFGNACGSTDTIVVFQSTEIILSAITTQSTGLNNGVIDISITGGLAPYSFIWNTGYTGEDLANIPAGVYTVLVTDANSCTATGSFQIIEILQAGFYASPSLVNLGNPVQFIDNSTGSPNSWLWDFGDGSTDNSQNPSHIYQDTGSYSVTLIVSDGVDLDTLLQSNLVSVVPNPIIVSNMGDNWYFGDHAGVTWNTLASNSDPFYLMDGEISTNEGCATVSDSNGILLFYTDGITVWNSQHLVMSNSTSGSPGGTLTGNPSSTQSAVIVPKPLDPNTYYIFSVDANLGSGGLAYSRVNMTANSGLGDIDLAEKNVPLFNPSTEKITAVSHANGTDVWVITHTWNNNQFRAYLVTSTGVNTSTPVYSNVGVVHSGTAGNSRGYMKASPSGNKVALGIEGMNIWQLFDFDNASGYLSNPITFDYTSNNDCYGVEFSFDEHYLYGSERWGYDLHQWDISLSTPPAILASHQIVATLGDANGGALQLGPDAKIYLARNGTKYLGRINTPGLAGTACNYVDQAILLGPTIGTARDSNEGLPNAFIQASTSTGLTADFFGSVTQITLGSSIQFIDQSSGNPISWTWDFGDGTSDTVQNPGHTYQTIGVYSVSLTVSNPQTSNMIVFQNYIEVIDSVIVPVSWSYTNTGSSHSILFPAGNLFEVDSVPLSPGDYVGVFYDNNGSLECAGFAPYSAQTFAVQAFADDTSTTDKDGFSLGETFQWKVWVASSTQDVDMLANYSASFPNEGQFVVNGMSGIESLIGTAFPVLSGIAVINGPSCYGDCNAAIDVSVSGGESPYNYIWSNGESTQDISGLCAGTYQLTVTDSPSSGNSTLPWQYTITSGNHIILILPTTTILLNGISAPTTDCWLGVFYETSSGGLQCGGYTEWTGVITSIAAWVVDVGNDGFVVNETFHWKAWLGSTGQEVDLTPTYLPTLPNQGQFAINGTSGVETLTGTYTPSTPVQASGINLSFVIEGPDTLSIAAVLSDYSGFPISSLGASDGSIDVSVAGGTLPYTYLWSNGASTEDLSNIGAGNYELTVTDGNGCTFIDSFLLTEPVIQTIFLPYYWSIFSTYMQPVQPGIAQFTADIVANINIIKDYEGRSFWPQFGVDLIGDLIPGQGYQIKMFAADTLYIAGSLIQPELLPIVLPATWSILGYIRTTPAPITAMLSSLGNNVEIVINGYGQVYWPQFGVNLIEELMPGEGYRIKMFSQDTLIYPANSSSPTGFTCGDQIFDYDGNLYNTVLIGNQCWMKENLKTTHFSNGTALTDGSNAGDISGDYTTKYHFDYFDNPTNTEVVGKLYTWAAVVNGTSGSNSIPSGIQGVCPVGWHVPSDEEWKILEGEADSQFGYPDAEWDGTGYRGFDAALNLKSTYLWSIVGGGTDLSGFSAFPGGLRLPNGTFYNSSLTGGWWSSTVQTGPNIWLRIFNYLNDDSYRTSNNKSYGHYVRCLKD